MKNLRNDQTIVPCDVQPCVPIVWGELLLSYFPQPFCNYLMLDSPLTFGWGMSACWTKAWLNDIWYCKPNSRCIQFVEGYLVTRTCDKLIHWSRRPLLWRPQSPLSKAHVEIIVNVFPFDSEIWVWSPKLPCWLAIELGASDKTEIRQYDHCRPKRSNSDSFQSTSLMIVIKQRVTALQVVSC